MQKITAHTSKVYDILIDSGLLNCCGDYIKNVVDPCKAMIVTDSNVAPLYLERVKTSLENSGFNVSSFVFPAGEMSKTFDTVYKIDMALADNLFTRKDIVVALGGGVTGDMAGFAASIYMRGIRFVQLSTTLLSDIDSSVGGKTGCDLPNGKNLVGAFHQPEIVLIDTDALSTLPQKFFNDGMGEAIKYGVIRCEKLFSDIKNKNILIEDLIYDCVKIKCNVVENDERESGERKLLNFGHTLGHAIEKFYNFDKLSHGEAVAIGMVMISKAAENNGICENGVSEKIAEVCKIYDLPTECDAPLEDLVKICLSDKKQTGKGIDLVLPEKIGVCRIENIKNENLLEFLRKD